MQAFDEPVVCPILVGRERQLAALHRLLDGVVGAGRTVLFAGEAGIGKSRLVAAARDLAVARGWCLVQGSFFEPDRSLPYAGLTDLVRRHLATISPDEAERLAALAPELAGLVPELDHVGAASAPLEGEQDKRRLFDAFARLLLAIGNGKPIAVVLEDLHWADDASLELLLHIARRTPTEPILLLLTYRADEVQPALAHFLAGVERERLASEIGLDRLTASEVDHMLRAILQRNRPVRAEVVNTIFALTDGNPFFVEEVVRSLPGRENEAIWDSGLLGTARIPHSVEESVQRRSQGLSPVGRNILDLAAVAGRRFDFPLLFRLSGLDEEGLLLAIKELIAAQLVMEESEDEFSFRHALTRQAIYNGLLLRERKLLHRRIKETIILIHGSTLDERYGDLAYHAFQAEDWPQALTSSALAGERALTLFSPGSAVEHFSRALEAAGHLPAASVGAVYRGRGKAYETLGDFEASRTDYEAALTAARAAKDAKGEWEAMLDLGMLWAGKDYGRTGEYFEAAIRLAETMGDPATIARSLNRVGNWYVNIEQPREGIERHQEALRVFQELGDSQRTAETLDLLGIATLISGDLARSAEYYSRAVAIFELLNDRSGLVSSLATLPIRAGPIHSDAVLPAETLPRAAEDGFSALQIAREIGWRAGESFALWDLAMSLASEGKFGQALELASAGLDIAIEIEHVQWQAAAHCVNGALFAEVFAFDSALNHLEKGYDFARMSGSLFWTKHAAAGLSRLFIARGELDRAAKLLEPFQSDSPYPTVAQAQVNCAWAELLLARNEDARALAALHALLPSPDVSRPVGTIARVAWLKGNALMKLGRYDEAEESLAEALAACLAQGRNHLTWRVTASLATLALKRGDRARAAELADDGRRLIEERAATLPEGALRDQFQGRALALVPGLRRLETTPQRALGLTAREQEVAGLVARGLSNRAIAESLVLSERTVETHVANALSKLSFSSRSQLAVWANEKGLANAS